MALRSMRYRCRGYADRTSRPIDERDFSPAQKSSRAFANTAAESLNEFPELATILEALQRTSYETVPERLIRSLIETAVQYAGAERGVLILYEGKEARVVAEATCRFGCVEVFLGNEDSSHGGLPDGTAELATRITEDAVQLNPLSSGDCIWQNRSGSVLGLPLILRGRLIALLYLENRHAPEVFTPERVVSLRLLAAQAAMALENMRLSQELQEREAQLRRLADANIIGIATWTRDGGIVEANDAFAQIIGATRNEIQSGRIRWADLAPPEWREQDERLLAELETKGSIQPYEREYRRRDGSRVPVLVGCTSLEGADHKRMCFVIDLTERKRAEAMLRKLRAELDHAMRVMTMGELGASIAHETTQPLTAIVTNASALLQWLESTPPNLAKAHETAEWIVRDGEWAADVVRGLQALNKKTLVRQEPVDLNKSIEEILPLVQGEIRHSSIALTIQSAQELLPALGDRVQLQQVILNLIKNSIDSMAAVCDRPRELLIATYNLDGESVGVLVRDTGQGVEPTKIDYLFDRFYTTKADGMGIGLSISRSIIQNHGGQIWATINPEFGMTFEFALPAYQPAEEGDTEEDARQSYGKTREGVSC